MHEVQSLHSCQLSLLAGPQFKDGSYEQLRVVLNTGGLLFCKLPLVCRLYRLLKG